jgi:hypothetical protein
MRLILFLILILGLTINGEELLDSEPLSADEKTTEVEGERELKSLKKDIEFKVHDTFYLMNQDGTINLNGWIRLNKDNTITTKSTDGEIVLKPIDETKVKTKEGELTCYLVLIKSPHGNLRATVVLNDKDTAVLYFVYIDYQYGITFRKKTDKDVEKKPVVKEEVKKEEEL